MTTDTIENPNTSVAEKLRAANAAAASNYRAAVIASVDPELVDPEVDALRRILSEASKTLEDFTNDVAHLDNLYWHSKAVAAAGDAKLESIRIAEQLEELDKQLAAMKLRYEQEREALISQAAPLREVQRNLQNVESEGRRAVQVLNQNAGEDLMQRLRKAGARKVAAQNNLRTAVSTLEKVERSRPANRIKQLEHTLQQASAAGRSHEVKELKAEIEAVTSELNTATRRRDAARKESCEAESAWDMVTAEMNDWRQCRLSDEPAADYFHPSGN